MIRMTDKVKIIVNEEEVPLNRFVISITEKLVLAIVDSLKGLDKEIKNVKIEVEY